MPHIYKLILSGWDGKDIGGFQHSGSSDFIITSGVSSLITTSVSMASDWTFCWTVTGTCTAWTWTPAAFSFSSAPPAGAPMTSSEPLMTPLMSRGCAVNVWLAVDTVTTPAPLPGCDTTRVCCACVGTVSLITCVPGATLTGARARTVRGLPRRLMPVGEAPTPDLFVPVEAWSWHWANWWAGMVMILASWTVILSPFSAVAGTMVGMVWIITCPEKTTHTLTCK